MPYIPGSPENGGVGGYVIPSKPGNTRGVPGFRRDLTAGEPSGVSTDFTPHQGTSLNTVPQSKPPYECRALTV